MTETLRVASYALIVEDERLLLCRISKEVPNSAGRWTLPGGGIEFGEHPEAAAVREVKEETGLDVRLTAIERINSEVFSLPDAKLHAIRVLYRADVIGGELRHEPEGSTDLVQWFTLEEAQRAPLVEVAKLGVRLIFGNQVV